MNEQRYQNSRRLFAEACQVIPGGVNSPVRAFRAVGGSPLFIEKGSGPFIWDADGHKYIDYVGSWGPMILGHTHPTVVKAVADTLQDGFSFGAPTERETTLAKRVQSFFPAMEQLRFVSSGTEACMSALRLARGYTGRNKILKFTGCYHGHADMLLVKAGSGIATLGIPGSPGVPEEATRHTLTVPFNDLEAVDKVFAEHGSDLAAVILEPLVGNAGFIRPLPEFLPGLRKRCDGKSTLLIFDEVMTGFRVHPGGVQGLLNIKTDLTTLGKVIGGGLPIGAYGGRKDIMQHIAPQGPVYQAGTLSGNPLACASGIATLETLSKLDFGSLSAKSQRLVSGFISAARDAGIALQGDSEGGMFGIFFAKEKVTNFEAAQKTEISLFNKFFHLMLERGVYLAPSAYEACFMSFAHDDSIIDQSIAAAKDAFRVLN